MKTIWKMDVLQDLISFYGKGIVPQYVDQKNCDAIWVLNQKCNTNHKISYDKARYTDIKHKPVSQERYLRIGDIIINATGYGTAGRVAQVDNLIGDTTVDSHMIIIRANYNKVHPKYLAYYMKHNQATIESYAEGSTGQTEISKNRLCYEFKVRYPDLETQKRIAKVLSALDDKIELNNQINKNLEEQAKSIYSKMFIESRPADYANGTLNEIADITMGQSPVGSSYNEEGLGEIFFQGRAEFDERFPTIRLYTTEPKRMAFANDTLISVRAPVGDLNVAHKYCCIGRGLAAIHSKTNHQSFLLYTMFSLKRQLEVFNGEGTVFGSINRDSLRNIAIYIPSIDKINDFENLVAPIDLEIRNNYDQICALQQIRDKLLPKLMSGEIDVDNVEI